MSGCKRCMFLSLAVIIACCIVSLFPFISLAEEDSWKLMGETDRGKTLFYIDTKNISQVSDSIVRFTGKEELSPEGLKERKKAFDKEVERAEKESGAKVEDPDLLFKMLIKSEIQMHTYEIDCKANEIKRLPSGKSFIKLVILDPIKPGSTEEKIKNELCKPNP